MATGHRLTVHTERTTVTRPSSGDEMSTTVRALEGTRDLLPVNEDASVLPSFPLRPRVEVGFVGSDYGGLG